MIVNRVYNTQNLLYSIFRHDAARGPLKTLPSSENSANTCQSTQYIIT